MKIKHLLFIVFTISPLFAMLYDIFFGGISKNIWGCITVVNLIVWVTPIPPILFKDCKMPYLKRFGDYLERGFKAFFMWLYRLLKRLLNVKLF